MTNRKSYGRIQWYYFGPSRVISNKGFRPQFAETVYISEVSGARKVQSGILISNQIKSNQIYLLKTSHLRVAIDKTVDEQGRQGSKEHLQ